MFTDDAITWGDHDDAHWQAIMGEWDVIDAHARKFADDRDKEPLEQGDIIIIDDRDDDRDITADEWDAMVDRA